MANYKKANGKVSGNKYGQGRQVGLLPDPTKNPIKKGSASLGGSGVKAKQVDNSVVSSRLDARKPVNNTLSAKTSNMDSVVSKRNAALSKLTNKVSGNKYGQGSQVGLLPDPTKHPIKTGKDALGGNYGSGADTGMLKGVGKASGKAPVVYETPGFKPAKKTSKK